MKRKFQIDGISCSDCITSVKKALEAHPAVEKTEIFLKPKGATLITMKKSLSIVELQKQLNGYTITEIN